MARADLSRPFPWGRYSKKLAARIETPRWAGTFTPQEVEGRNIRLVTGEEGSLEGANLVRFYWLVDETDGVILDVKHQTFGQSALIGAAEVASELCCGKNYDQALRIGADLIDKHVRDKTDIPAFPAETSAHLNLAIGAIEAAAHQCTGMPLPSTYVTPMPLDFEIIEGGYPGFEEMSNRQQIALIETLIQEEIRPYIELDDGGVEIRSLIDKKLTITYQGSCTSCHAATGTTLSTIQQILRAKIHPDLTVIPEL
ncbi:MAG: NifU family protein [Parachlamydiales bacterium]